MKKIILIAVLLFSGTIFAFANTVTSITFYNHTSESLTIAQAGNNNCYTSMPGNSITIAPNSESAAYTITDGDPENMGVQGFDIYNSDQSQDTHLETAFASFSNAYGMNIDNLSNFNFGGFVKNNPNSSQTAWNNIDPNPQGNVNAISILYNSNSTIPFIITDEINGMSGSILVNIYNPSDLMPNLLAGQNNMSFYTSNYSTLPPALNTHNSGIFFMNTEFYQGIVFVEQNGSFIPWGGSGQWGTVQVTGISNYAFNSDGTLNFMTVNVEDGSSWTYANGQWSHN